MISIKSQKWHMQWLTHMDSVTKLDRSISGECPSGLRSLSAAPRAALSVKLFIFSVTWVME